MPVNFKKKMLSILAWKKKGKKFSLGLFHAVSVSRPDFPDKCTTNKEYSIHGGTEQVSIHWE